MSNNFYWSNFNEAFIRSVVYNDKTPSDSKPSTDIEDIDLLIPYMDNIAGLPTPTFVSTYRTEIEDLILQPNPNIAKSVYKYITHKRSVDSRAIMAELRSMPLSHQFTAAYSTALAEIGCGYTKLEYDSPFKLPMSIDLQNTICNDVPLYDFQKEAVSCLENDYLINKKRAGLLVMPTGSGKTKTATYFLLKYMIPSGYQVIWLTHRHMLVDQAADAFVNNCSLVKDSKPKSDKFTITCVSGQHSNIKIADKTDNVIIISVQSGFRNLPYLQPILGKKVIVVIDEAHHSVAKSYQRIMDYIYQQRKGTLLLGLTATPIRGTDKESQILYNIFNRHIIYDISMNELIIKRILAEPQFQQLNININFEPKITVDEGKLIKRYGELPPSVIQKVANSAKRNKLIVKTYLDNRKQYGKTLIFALNVEHCVTLCKDFKKAGVKADFIYSGKDDNDRIIRDFQADRIDVLININILTEGSDVPKIQTIFLTRPTQSEGLLVQMIGRGLRGPKAQGTAIAYIVDFCDKWDVFNKWLNPEVIMHDAEELPEKTPRKAREVKRYPLQLILDIYKEIAYHGDSSLSMIQGLPVGWYDCSRSGNDDKILVFSGQEDAYAELTRFLNSKDPQSYAIETPRLFRKFFCDLSFPPYMRDIDRFIKHYLLAGIPEYHPLNELDAIDVMEIAKQLLQDNIGLAELYPHIQNIYSDNTEIIDSVYGGFVDFYNGVMTCITSINQGYVPDTKLVLFPPEQIPYNPTPAYDLQELYKEVVNEMFGGTYDGIEYVHWTSKPCRNFFGQYTIGGRILINSLLNSPDVPREVVKFVIYHELLHRDNMSHNKFFKKKEHLYPGYVELDRFLDNTFNKFTLKM